jgi:hypothetical protein
MESLTFVAPIAYTLDWLILFSDASKVLTLGIVSTLGVVAGSARVALATRASAGKAFAGTEDTANHLVGAVLMGVGGVTAMGCTIGQGLSGVSTLALGSFMALAAIMAGAVLGCAGRPGGWSASCESRRRPQPLSRCDDADLERRFGGLRRLYGDAGYARCVRRARGGGGPGRRGLVGGRGAGAQRRGRAGADRPRPRRRVQHQPPGAGAGRHAGPGQGRWRCAERIADIHPGCRVQAVEDFVSPTTGPACCRCRWTL